MLPFALINGNIVSTYMGRSNAQAIRMAYDLAVQGSEEAREIYLGGAWTSVDTHLAREQGLLDNDYSYTTDIAERAQNGCLVAQKLVAADTRWRLIHGNRAS